jgi:DNA-binding HxlR family transcriptional regulator
VIGDRWSLLLLRDVMFGSRRHFRVRQERSAEGVASNILAERLRQLVADGLLTWAQVGRGHRAEYSLTEAAIQLVPVMAALGRRAYATTSQPHRCECGPSCWLTAGPIFGG